MPQRSRDENNDADQEAVIAFLSRPETYGLQTGSVERHETHGAYVFLAGDRAYKLKRAVKLPYLDYSTVELRHEMCERELAINRAISPELYLDVRPIVQDGKTLRFGSANDRNVADWVVVMRRFDQKDLLEQLRTAGKLDRPLMLLLAETIADFHCKADIDHSNGGAGGLRAVTEENAQILRRQIGRPFRGEDVERYIRAVEHCFREVRSVLSRRMREGRVRRCHGDLHLNNVCMIAGKPLLFDALEFSERFSSIDTLYDLAFMLMDIDRHGLRVQANILLNRYLECTEDYAGLAALPLFMSCRAALRAHIAALRKETWEDAGTLLNAASDYLKSKPTAVLAIGGYSGSGKTTLAYRLAPALGVAPGGIAIRTDVIRKHLMGVEEIERLGEKGYAASVSKKVYETVSAYCAICADAGYTVLADGVFGTDPEREAIMAVARDRNVPFVGVWLDASPDLLKQRVEARRGDASDATSAVIETQLKTIIPPTRWHIMPAAQPMDVLARQVTEILRPLAE